MKCTIDVDGLRDIIEKQLSSMLVLKREDKSALGLCIASALASAERCFAKSRNKYYMSGDDTSFDPFHSGQYCIFLYWLARYAFGDGMIDLASRLYYLNKIVNAVDLFYEVELPSIFDLDHPLASVMGRANYADYFFFTQNCTVGNSRGRYPVIGRNVSMYARSAIMGSSRVGDNCIIAANAFIMNQDIPSNSVVFGTSPNLVIKGRPERYFLDELGRWRFNI